VQCQTRIAAQVERLERARHHAQPHPIVGDHRLDAADAGRAVSPQGGEQTEAVCFEALADPGGEVRGGSGELVPGGHERIVPRHP
jgi:hypothetical protein